jgi:hypothetical protein
MNREVERQRGICTYKRGNEEESVKEREGSVTNILINKTGQVIERLPGLEA